MKRDDEVAEKLPAGPGPRQRRKRNIVIFCVVTVLNAGLLLLLWSQLVTPAQRQGASSNGLGNNPLVGHTAPNFTLNVLSAHSMAPLRLDALRGRPVVLNFWASWCQPCQEEAPTLQKEWQQAQGKGVVFLGVDYQDAVSDGLGFVRHYGISFTNVMDAQGQTAINYGVTATPETFFIDRHGVVVGWYPGTLSAKMLQGYLQKLAQ